MKKLIFFISAACISFPVFADSASTSTLPPAFEKNLGPGFSPRAPRPPQAPHPNWDGRYGPGWGSPSGFNRGNNRYGSNFNTPDFNWGNGNHHYGSGSSFSMPNFNWGNGNNRNGSHWGNSWGNNWDMPSFNWGSNNSNRNRYMPRWNGPAYNRGAATPPPGYWAPNMNYNTYVQPPAVSPKAPLSGSAAATNPLKAPAMPSAPGIKIRQAAPGATYPPPEAPIAPKSPIPATLSAPRPAPAGTSGMKAGN